MELYRFVTVYESEFESEGLRLHKYEVDRETPCGYWLKDKRFINGVIKERWVSNNSMKRWAYPTKQEALVNFTKRTKKRMMYLNISLRVCKKAMVEAEQYQFDSH